MIRKILLGGASCLALLGAAGEASAINFVDTTPGVSSFTAPTAGSYTVSVWGAQGGAGYGGYTPGGGATFAGGLGYGQRASFHLTAGETVNLFVGAKGGDASIGAIGGGGGGGGASGLLLGSSVFLGSLVSGGGGGGGKYGAGYNGQAASIGAPGGAGGGSVAHPGGPGGVFGSPGGYSRNGAPGGGLDASSAGPHAGKSYFAGGAGGTGFASGGPGGFGYAGGGGGYLGGGGGGGISGGGGGDKYGGGGGGSYNFGGKGQTALAFNTGNGEIEISSSVPEPSTWAMMFGGFGFTGYVLRRRLARRRVMRPA